jgi:hypothetical protein
MARTATRELVAALLAKGETVAVIAAQLGISQPTVCYHKRKLGYPMDPRFACRYDWEAVQSYYDEGHSTRACMKRFGFSAWAWSYAVKRGTIKARPQAIPPAELFVLGRTRNRNHLKLRLVAAGLKDNRCEECGIDEWRGKPLSMSLHHVNGDGRDNRVENLAMLCPNCHSQTPNFGVKNWRARVLRESGRRLLSHTGAGR